MRVTNGHFSDKLNIVWIQNERLIAIFRILRQ